MGRDLKSQLATIRADDADHADHWSLFTATGCTCPRLNHLTVSETFQKFSAEMLPLFPLEDPTGRRVSIREDTFPKTISLEVRDGLPPKRASRIVEELRCNQFDQSQYRWAKDRIKHLFWIPEIISNPDAIYVKNKRGLIRASEVFVRVYDRELGSRVKLVFVDQVGKNRNTIFITSFITDPNMAIRHCIGHPLYRRKIAKPPD